MKYRRKKRARLFSGRDQKGDRLLNGRDQKRDRLLELRDQKEDAKNGQEEREYTFGIDPHSNACVYAWPFFNSYV